MMNVFKSLSIVAIAASLLIGAAGCASGAANTHMEGSRHELYESAGQMIGASSAVITGKVTEQVVVGDSSGREPGEGSLSVTVSTLSVLDSYSPAGLGEQAGIAQTVVEDEMSVRQMGVYGDTLPYPILEKGKQYLLFLVPTRLEGKAANDFYIVGGSAGMYTVESGVFVHVLSEEGDTLPEKLTSGDLN